MSPPSRTGAPLVLVVEDEEDTRELIGFLLDIAGYDVLLARTGEDALAILSTRTPAAITIDIGLPGMSGLDVAKAVRLNQATRTTPLVAVTGWSAKADIDRALAAGCDVVLVKPCPPETLSAEIGRLLSLRADSSTGSPDSAGPARPDSDR